MKTTPVILISCCLLLSACALVQEEKTAYKASANVPRERLGTVKGINGTFIKFIDNSNVGLSSGGFGLSGNSIPITPGVHRLIIETDGYKMNTVVINIEEGHEIVFYANGGGTDQLVIEDKTINSTWVFNPGTLSFYDASQRRLPVMGVLTP